MINRRNFARENHQLLQSTQETTQPDASRTSLFLDPHLDPLQYDEEPLDTAMTRLIFDISL